MKGAALSAEASAQLDKFISELAGGLNLWKGPLNFQDGTPFLKEGEVATDLQVWYLPQLLEAWKARALANSSKIRGRLETPSPIFSWPGVI